MGQLVNPSGFRVGRTTMWSFRWSSDAISYFKFLTISQSIQHYLIAFFSKIIKKSGFLFSHLKLLISLSRICVSIYVYSRDFLKFCRRRFLFFWAKARAFIFMQKNLREKQTKQGLLNKADLLMQLKKFKKNKQRKNQKKFKSRKTLKFKNEKKSSKSKKNR